MPQASQSDPKRIVIPKSLRRPIKVRISDGESGRLHEYMAQTPLRVGYGQNCEVRLDGENGPDTLFEFLPVDGPTKLSMPARFSGVPDQFDVSIDGEPYHGTMRELRPGTKVQIRDRSSNRHVDLIVDEPPYRTRKRRLLIGGLLSVLLAGFIYGLYTFRSIDDTNERLSQAETRLSRAESRDAAIDAQIAGIIDRVDSNEVAVDAALDEIQSVHRRSQTELKEEFASRLRQITKESQAALVKLAREDTAGREALSLETAERVSALRQDISQKLLDGIERFDALEEHVYLQQASQLESLAVRESRFKRVLPVASSAVLYVKSEFTAVLTVTGETKRFDSSGTAFLVSDSGMAIAPLHVLEPWRFDEDFLALRELGAVEVQPQSVKRHVWLAGDQVIDPNDPTKVLIDSAFTDGNAQRGMVVLYKPEIETVTKLVVTPLGVVQIERPTPGPTDLAVFQLTDFEATFSHLTFDSGEKPLQPLDKVLVVGFPLGRLDTGRSNAQGVMGTVRRVGGDLLELDTALHPGISGAPVLNDEARIVGMAIAVFGTVSYGVSVPANRLVKATELARDWVLENELRLADMGCEPGPIDGNLDKQTWLASQRPGCEFQ